MAGPAPLVSLRSISQKRSDVAPAMTYLYIALAAIVLVFIAAVVMQPPAFRITRSLAMSAPIESVFAQVNDFHNWQAWSPWAKIDSQMKQTYEGPVSGTGAKYAWVG